jgi:hypothetical protein
MKQYLEFTDKTDQQFLDAKKAEKDSVLAYRKHIFSRDKPENFAFGRVETHKLECLRS